MSPDTHLRDAKRKFAETLTSMMEGDGMFDGRYSADELRGFVRGCTEDGFVLCWDEFMRWIEQDDPRRAETLATLRASIRRWE